MGHSGFFLNQQGFSFNCDGGHVFLNQTYNRRDPHQGPSLMTSQGRALLIIRSYLYYGNLRLVFIGIFVKYLGPVPSV